MKKSKRELYTEQDFQKFIEDNNILSPRDFRERFKTEYNWAVRSEYLKAGNRKLTFPGWIDTSKLKTVEDFKKFVKDKGVKNVADMLKRFPAVDKMMRARGIKSSDIGYTDLVAYNPDLKKYTLDYIQKYIIDNKIVYLDDIRKQNMSMYAKIIRSKWDKVLKFPLRPISNPCLKNYNTLEDFQNLIDSDDRILAPRDFEKYYPDIYARLYHLKLADKVIYKGRIQKRLEKGLIESINTFEEFQQFIQDQEIYSPRDFQERFYGLYRKSLLLSKTLDYDSYKQSYPEKITKEVLDDLGISTVSQKSFSWMPSLRIDFYSANLNLAIEVQGDQHFIPIEYFGGEEVYQQQFERDTRKFNLCKEHGITLIYVYFPELSSCSKQDKQSVLKKISDYFSEVIIGKAALIDRLTRMNKNREDD